MVLQLQYFEYTLVYDTYVHSLGSAGPEIRVCSSAMLLRIPAFDPTTDGKVTSLRWADNSTLVFGTSDGHVYIWATNDRVSN